MASVAELVLRTTADISDAEGKLGRLGGALGGIGKLAAAGAVAAGAAIVGVAAKGVTEFAGFERQMNEVFTLLPGISQGAMSQMTDQVLALSKDFGVLPQEVVPALYQALSAGVPPENVFDFMETAVKTSIGGVTDLETSVDGVTSVVNAFGTETISASEASDLMFTTVRLGKTTMDELSRALFQVNPVAAGLGINFGDVSAAMATLTSQGVPTSAAATQLRQSFVELSKEGTKTSDVFKDTAGVSFRDFIASGGTVQEAMMLMKGAADEMGVGVNDLFGSVEAGNAVLALTSEQGAATFSGAMEEMQGASGATQGAFEQMDQGLGRSWDRIKANTSAALITIGATLAPFVEKATEWFMGVLPGAIDFLQGVFERLGPVLAAVWETIEGVISGFVDFFTASAGPRIQGVSDLIGSYFEMVRSVAETVWGMITQVIETFVGIFERNRDTIAGIIQTVIGIWQTLQEAVQFVIDVIIEIVGGFTEVLESRSKDIDGIVSTIGGIFEGFAEVVRTVFEGIRAFWEEWGGTITNIFQGVFGGLITFVGGALDVIKGIIETVLGILTGDWARAWEGIKQIFEGVWNALGGIVEAAWAVLIGILGGLWSAFSGWWSGIWESVKSFFSGIWDALAGIASGAWGVLTGTLSGLWNAFSGWWSGIWETTKEGFGIAWDALTGLATTGWNAFRGWLDSAWALFSGWWSKGWEGIKNAAGSILGGLVNVVSGAVTGAVNWVIDRINDAIGVLNRAIDAYNSLPLPNVGNVGTISRISSPKPTSPNVGHRFMQSGGHVFRPGFAMLGEAGRELAYMPAGAHVFPNELTEALLSGGRGGSSQPILIQLNLDSELVAEVLVDPIRRELLRTDRRNVGVGFRT